MSKKRYGNELHPLYSRWLSTTQRCNNPNNCNYRNYGARGITLSPELASFTDYCAYVTQLPDYDPVTKSLDRIDNARGYEKGNLRWVSYSAQIANQRFSGKGTNRFTGVSWATHHQRWVASVHYEGKTLFTKVCLTEQAALQARNQYIIEHNLPHTIQAYE